MDYNSVKSGRLIQGSKVAVTKPELRKIKPVIHLVCTSVILCHVSIAQVNHDTSADDSEMLLTVEQYKDSINRETCHLGALKP